MKKPNPLVPQFTTMLFSLVPLPEMGVKHFPIPMCCEDHLLPEFPAMRVKYLAFLGFQLFKRVEYMKPTADVEANHGA